MKIFLALFLGLGMATVVSANSHEFRGKVIQVLDGNTLIVKTEENEDVKIMLYGIDCPELEQAYGKDARKCLERLLLKKNVNVEIMGMARNGTQLGVVTTDKKMDPRAKLLQEGLAWTTESNPLPELESYRVNAEQKKVGLWKQKEPTPPWIYRRQQSMATAKFS